jgi:hypothetical protein
MGYKTAPSNNFVVQHLSLGEHIMFYVASVYNCFLWTKNFFLASAAGLFVAGVFILNAITIVCLIKKKKIKENLFPITLICFGCIFIFSITFGRTQFGLGIASSSRYITFSSMFWIGSILLFYQNAFAKVRRGGGIFIALILILANAQMKSFNTGRQIYEQCVLIEDEIKNYDIMKNKRNGIWRADKESLSKIEYITINRLANHVYKRKE